MIACDVRVNEIIKVPFVSTNNQTGLTSFSFIILKDGDVYTGISVPPTVEEVGSGLYILSITLNATGIYTVFVNDQIVSYFNCVTKDSYSILQDLNDELHGSWRHDKVAGTVTLYRPSGSVLATFTFNDNNDATEKERT